MFVFTSKLSCHEMREVTSNLWSPGEGISGFVTMIRESVKKECVWFQFIATTPCSMIARPCLSFIADGYHENSL